MLSAVKIFKIKFLHVNVFNIYLYMIYTYIYIYVKFNYIHRYKIVLYTEKMLHIQF